MKLMMVCPRCNGEGWHERGDLFKNIVVGGVCTKCHGVKFIAPPQQILDDLECAEIKRYLNSKGYNVNTTVPNDFVKHNRRNVGAFYMHIQKFEHDNLDKNIFERFDGNSELEALRKAKAWLNGRGAE